MVLGTLPHGMCSPFAEIDLLYAQILDAVPASKIEKTLLCLGAIIGQNHFKLGIPINEVAFLDELLPLNSGGVEHLLRELHSVLTIQSGVSICHKSFSDFLKCKIRSGRYYIDKDIVWADVLGLLWATIPRWLNQFCDVQSVNLKPTLKPHSRTWLLIS